MKSVSAARETAGRVQQKLLKYQQLISLRGPMITFRASSPAADIRFPDNCLRMCCFLLVGHKWSKMKVMMPFPLGRSGRVDAVIGYCFKRPKYVPGGCLSNPGSSATGPERGGGTGGGAEEVSYWKVSFSLSSPK